MYKDNLQTQLLSLQLELAEKNKTIQKYKKENASCKKVIGEYKHSLSKCKKVIGEYKHSLSKCKQVIGEYKHSLSQCEQVIGEYKHSLSQCEQVIGEYKHSLSQCEKQTEQHSHLVNTALGNEMTKKIPEILLYTKDYLKSKLSCSFAHEDGRVNSCIDEQKIIDIMKKDNFLKTKLHEPKKRMWYDILLKDDNDGWIPVNIKSTTTMTSDNTGNFAMCVHAYTDQDIRFQKSTNNGVMSRILFKKIVDGEFNTNPKKDYYFLVVNKNDTSDIIVNSVLGLTSLTANINNLPFQIKWSKNRNFNFKSINDSIEKLVKVIQKPKPSWIEQFLRDMRKLKLLK